MDEFTVISRDWSVGNSNTNIESRSSLENPQSPLSFPNEWLLDVFNGGRTDSGIRVSEYTAFQTSTFLACADIIAGKIASLPRHVYEKRQLPNGRDVHRVATDHDYYDLLSLEPNPEMNGNTFFKAMLLHGIAWSNAYVEIQRDSGASAVALWPRNPGKTRPSRLLTDIVLPSAPWRPYPRALQAGTMVFETTDGMESRDTDLTKSTTKRIIPAEDMIHIPGITFDGRLGQSVVWLARQTIGLALAMEKFGAKYFANFARPGGLLVAPTNLSDPQKENAKRSWREAQGGENSQGVAVMPPGWEWKPMSNNPQESQTIESRKLSRNEICAILHVPVHMVGGEDKGRSNTEQLAQELKEYCLDPWMSSIRVEMKRKLFPHRGVGRMPRNNFFLDFDLDGMLRPDAASREKFNASGKQWGYLNTNDIRAREKLNPVMDANGKLEDWAEEYWMPANMTLTTTPLDPGSQDGAGNGVADPTPAKPPVTSDAAPTAPTAPTAPASTAPPKPPAKSPAKSHLFPAYIGMFTRAFTRVCHHSTRDQGAFNANFLPIFHAVKSLYLDEATAEMRMPVATPIENTHSTDRFISQYLSTMQKRGKEWPVEAATDSDIVGAELTRALLAIRISVYQEVATEKAKSPTDAELDSLDAIDAEVTEVVTA